MGIRQNVEHGSDYFGATNSCCRTASAKPEKMLAQARTLTLDHSGFTSRVNRPVQSDSQGGKKLKSEETEMSSKEVLLQIPCPFWS